VPYRPVAKQGLQNKQRDNGRFYVVRSESISLVRPRSFQLSLTRVEAGLNTSTLTLRVVGGDEKGSLKSETVKYGRESQGTRTIEGLCWQGPAAYTTDRPVLPSERAPHKKTKP
jgi:hypothetical protein